MSNPNLQSIGKRKAPVGSQNPDWLFPTTGKRATASSPNVPRRSQAEQVKKLANSHLKAAPATETTSGSAPELVYLVGDPLLYVLSQL